MDNYQIADAFSLLAKLMDIHGENPFKSKSYASAAFAMEKLPMQLSEIPADKIASIKGIGASSAGKIIELINTGELKILGDLVLATPPGIIEMLSIKGIGAKKIHTIWKEMEIETIGELLYACKENRLKLYKGFGEKTQENVAGNIDFYLKSKGSFLYAQVDAVAPLLQTLFEKIFTKHAVEITGDYKRQQEIIHVLEFVIDADELTIENGMKSADDFELLEKNNNSLLYNSGTGLKIKLHATGSDQNLAKTLLKTSSPEAFFKEFEMEYPQAFTKENSTEQELFENAGLQYVAASLRDQEDILKLAAAKQVPNVIQPGDIKGIIHSHSNWSDGSNTVEEMANAAIERGLEYLVMSDHSKSAFYAKGLFEDRIREQHLYIDELNKKLHPFRIFKSIESDILNDGGLDYSNNILASFDLVIASVHSNLKMTEEKAMMRLMNAIENPYTTILGHMTGRLLLSRPGYPVDHDRIIDACAANQVVIELNAHPNRLDIDWRYIRKAISKGVLISIDPDAHHTSGLDDTRFGVMVAQKAMVTAAENLSSYSREAFEAYISNRKELKNI